MRSVAKLRFFWAFGIVDGMVAMGGLEPPTSAL